MSVLVFHFVCYYNGNKFIVESETIRTTAEFGAQGVELFYCISGFVIMFALSKNEYKLRFYGHYLLKRILRIIPVYWMTIVAIYAMEFVLGKLYWDSTLVLDWNKIVLNSFFLVDLFEGQSWINPVFSTLGVEFQFYVLIGVLFPLFKLNKSIQYGILMVWLFLGYATFNNYTVLVNGPFFIAGILLFDWYKNPEDLLSKWGLFGLMVYLSYVYPLEDAVVVALTIVCFGWLKPSVKPLNRIGNFSYSLYLTHGVLGGWFLYFQSQRELSIGYSWMLICVAITLSLLGAYVFYWFVEKPAMRWSKMIQWRSTRSPK